MFFSPSLSAVCCVTATSLDEVNGVAGNAVMPCSANFDFTSSNEVAVTQQTADKLGLKNISDLEGKSQDLTLYGSPECRGRDDCLRGLQNVYGLKFK